MSARVLCLGEALIDAVSANGLVTEHVGGSLLNVAAGVARLGYPASIGAWWGKDIRGDRLAQAAADAGVMVEPGTDGASHTTVAFATIDADGHATYTFDIEWALPALTDLESVTHLHTGSIAATLEPGGSQVVKAVRAVRPHATVSFDPNVRPALMGSPNEVVARMEEFVAAADVVKASDEDLAWLYPGTPIEDVMRRWVSMGPAMLVATRGPWGAYAVLANNRDMMVIDQVDVQVADTVGAGDSFMAGLIAGLLGADLLGSAEARERLRQAQWTDVQPALHQAVVTSSITVSQAGAYAPTPGEVATVLDTDPRFSRPA